MNMMFIEFVKRDEATIAELRARDPAAEPGAGGGDRGVRGSRWDFWWPGRR